MTQYRRFLADNDGIFLKYLLTDEAILVIFNMRNPVGRR